MSQPILDLLVVGAGPTGIAIGAAARQAGVDVLLVDQGPLVAAIEAYPTFMRFFTTRERLEIADIPFTIPDVKPSREQALVYYREVVRHYEIPLALFEKVWEVTREGDLFRVETRGRQGSRRLRARAVALATGYFFHPRSLGVPGEDLPWVHGTFKEPYAHFGEHVLVVGGGNSAAETALDLWRNQVRVTLVHRGDELKPTIKYWVKPDLENRIAEGSIEARFRTVVKAFLPERRVELERDGKSELLDVDAVYLHLGYTPDADFLRQAGVEVEEGTLLPQVDPETCESNVPGLYVAGTLQAGRRTDKIFIENSRDHGPRIVSHLLARLGRPVASLPVARGES